jgi:hypothetical protein
MKVPQANDIAKIIDIPLAVANGSHTLNGIAKRYSFDRRQAMYYLEAAEMLGLIVRSKGRYSLTPIGQKYVALDYPDKRELLARHMLSLPIVASVLVELLVSQHHRVSRTRLQEIASGGGRISGTTVARRAQTLLKWFEWLGKETGAFKTTRDSLTLSAHP